MTRLDNILELLCSSRRYTESLLASIEPDDWFRQPAEGVTHVAWQVGHLAVVEYYLALKRVRGQQPDDSALVPNEFFGLFGKGSVPDPDANKYPNVDEIRQVFDRVHQHSLEELKTLSDDVLDQATEPAHELFQTKGGALQWCPLHEMIHAGQIGLVRRLFGSTWLR